MKYPTYKHNLFSDQNLAYPFEHYRAIRDAGAAVKLSRFGPIALSRYRDVKDALQASSHLISGKGVGINPLFNTLSKGKTTISLDGSEHKKSRRWVMPPLLRAKVAELESTLQGIMDEKMSTLVGSGTFDGISELAQHLPINVISHLVGVTEGLRREFLGWGSAGFDAAGPFGKRTPSVLSQLQRAFRYVESIEEGTIVPGGWADQAMDAFRAGELTLDEARMTISAYLFPSLDTTILTAGNMLYELAANPEQWQLLKENPDLISSAVDEAVRHASAVRCFTRYTADDYSTDDVFIPKGKRVVILYAAANRDERHYEHPNEFLVTRSAKDNLGFGSGAHVCAGQHLAKMEIKVLLQSLLKHANIIESDTPSRLVNAGVWGYTRLPMRLV